MVTGAGLGSTGLTWKCLSEAAGSRIWIMEGSDGEGHVHTHSEARCCEISAGTEKIALASGERLKTATNSSSQDGLGTRLQQHWKLKDKRAWLSGF